MGRDVLGEVNYLKFRCQRCPDGFDNCDINDPASCGNDGMDCATCHGNETIGVKKHWWAQTYNIDAKYKQNWPISLSTLSTIDEMGDETKDFEIAWLRKWDRTEPHLEGARTARSIFLCPEAEKTGACLGGENVQACKLGHNWVSCATCEDNFAPNSDGQCDACGNEKVGQKAVAVIFGMVAACFAFWLSVKFITPEIAVKVKILISMGQVLGGFKETYQIKWPKFMKRLLEEFKIFNFDLFSFGNMGCQVPEIKNFYYKFAMTVVTPAFLVGIVAGLFIIRLVVLKGKRLQDKEPHARLVHILEDLNFRGACFSKAFFILILLYLKTSATILLMFNCREFQPGHYLYDEPVSEVNGATLWDTTGSSMGSGNPGASRRLQADYDRDCESELYGTMTYVGLIFVAIYPFGVPATFTFLLMKNRKTINDSINIQRYGFIFKDYGPVFFYWEIWDLVRKLTMSGLLIFFDKGSADQLTLAILFSTVALVLHTRCFPYSDMASNWIQLSVLAALQLTLFGSLVLKMDSGSGSIDDTAVDIYLLVINGGIPCILCSVVAYEVQRAFTAKARAKLKLAKRRKRQQQLLNDSSGIDMKTIAKTIEAEEAEAAERKANSVGLGTKMAKGSGLNMMTAASMAVTKGVAHRVNIFASRATSAKDLFPTLAEEKLAVKRLQYDKERAEEAFAQADREATDLAEWISFARNHSASENELMSFVKAFGDELLGDTDVGDMDVGELDLMSNAKGKRSAAVVLADNYPFIRSAALALRRHHFG